VELRQLRYFAALAEELHFRRAAEVLNIAQPTLSLQIMALESELGARLFERGKRSVRLSAAGNVFLSEVQAILRQVDLAENHVREAEAGRRGVLEIGSTGPPMGAALPRVIRAFRAANPEITLVVRMMYSSDILEELKDRRIQVGFGRGGMEADELASEELWSLPYRTVLPRGHPQANRKSVRLDELSGETLITYPRKLIGESYDQLLAFCHAHGFKPKAVEEVNDAASMLGLVTCGLGVSIGAFTGSLDAADVVTRPIAASKEWRFPIAAYWRTDAHSPLMETLLDAARCFEQERNDSSTL
jgi:DNA-binding transcriptional LysR family regulator